MQACLFGNRDGIHSVTIAGVASVEAVWIAVEALWMAVEAVWIAVEACGGAIVLCCGLVLVQL